MSVLREPKMEPEDAYEPNQEELRFSTMIGTGHHHELPVPASEPIEVKDEIEEDAWEAIEDGPLVAQKPAGSEQKCFSQNRCDSVVTHVDGTKTRKGGNFKCEMCGCHRSTNQSLQRHMRTHTDERPFECPICGKPFRLNCTLQDHLPTHSADRSFTCDLCDFTTKSRSALSTHRKKHFETPFECKVCGKGFHDRMSYYNHLDEEHPSAVYKCDSCSFETTRRDKYSEHMKNKERGPCGQHNITCKHCDFRTASMHKLYHHMTVRKAKGNCFRAGLGPIFECVLCRFKTLREGDMQNHIDRRGNGRCKTVNRRLSQRCIELLKMPGRETIFVRDSIPQRPSKQNAHQVVE